MRITIAFLLVALMHPLLAAELKVVGDQIILSGRAGGDELALVRNAIAEHGSRITTVVFRDHTGRTNNDDLQRIADIITERGWRTAVSGFCGTACSKMFMGGRQRHFTDDRPPGATTVMFGSATRVEDSRSRSMQFSGDKHITGNPELRHWIKQRSNGRLSDALLDRLFVPDHSVHYLLFFDSQRLKRADGVSILVCNDSVAPADRWKSCDKVAGTDAYKEGIVTSTELLRSNDRPANSPAGSSARQ